MIKINEVKKLKLTELLTWLAYDPYGRACM